MSKNVVYKYPIALQDEFAVHLPVGARVLCVQVQRGQPFIWAHHTAESTKVVPRRFRLAGTGHPIVGDWRYVGTFQLEGGALVFHLFEEP